MRLTRYLASRFGRALVGVIGGFAAIVILLEAVELIGDLSGTGAGPTQAVRLALLAAPGALYDILPLMVVLAAVALFLALARSSELVVIRAAGRSGIAALWGPVLVTLGVGVLAVGLGNPIVAATGATYAAVKAELRGQAPRVAALGRDGLWLRQADPTGQTVIHAAEASTDGTELSAVTLLTFAPGGLPLRRITGASARLTLDGWQVTDAKVWPLSGAPNPEAAATVTPSLLVPSTLTPEQIRDSFGDPAQVPVWELPGFIAGLQAAGFSALRHQVWLQSQLALPVTLMAMVLIAAGFTMRHQRAGRTGAMALAAVMAGFALHFVGNFAKVLGETGQLPVALAVWSPPVAGALLALTLLLHREDG